MKALWYILIMALAFSFAGCGAVDRFASNITGDASETCHEGVMYLQFTSGASVMFNPDGSIHTCNGNS